MKRAMLYFIPSFISLSLVSFGAKGQVQETPTVLPEVKVVGHPVPDTDITKCNMNSPIDRQVKNVQGIGVSPENGEVDYGLPLYARPDSNKTHHGTRDGYPQYIVDGMKVVMPIYFYDSVAFYHYLVGTYKDTDMQSPMKRTHIVNVMVIVLDTLRTKHYYSCTAYDVNSVIKKHVNEYANSTYSIYYDDYYLYNSDATTYIRADERCCCTEYIIDGTKVYSYPPPRKSDEDFSPHCIFAQDIQTIKPDDFRPFNSTDITYYTRQEFKEFGPWNFPGMWR